MMGDVPFVAIRNDQLGACLKIGESLSCRRCGETHEITGTDDGTTDLLSVRCGEDLMLCGVAGRRVLFPGGV